jgi:DNA-binding response OmpR family regulator
MNLESLLVSRDSEVVRLLQTTLEKLSIGVEVSAAARSGTEVLSSSKYDAIIIDCDDLQGGADVLRNLRKTPSNKTSVSFAILNGKTTTQQAFEMGANFVLQKPLTTSTTLRCFNAALGFMERERRRYFRCPVKMLALLHLGDATRLKVNATNLSEGGMAIHLDGAMPKQSIAKINFTLPGSKVVIESKAEIAWADGKGRVGIRFAEIPDSSRQQLEGWVLRRIEQSTSNGN